jgi:Response regulator containing a CheY-like receiver domain and an HTH DNA-binding domain
MDKIKSLFSKPESIPSEMELETIVPGIDTPYGKKLGISRDEKIKLAESLTPREKDTYLLLLEGYTLKETAKQLEISYSTANTYQTAVYRKLHVKSRAELIINYHDIGTVRKD